MNVRVVTPPAIEPVSLSEVKLQARIDYNDEDTLLAAYIKTARQFVEENLSRALITQTLEVVLDTWWPASGLELPMPPVQSVTHVKYTDADGAEQTLDANSYVLDVLSGRLMLKPGYSYPTVSLWPIGAVVIRYVAGYGSAADNVPEPIRQAIRMLAVHYYENREAVLVERGGSVQMLPFAVDALLANYRVRVF
ncbi:MAG: hypothetical protein KatS3mg054_0655 [Chloroflexus sp.]|nr:MAG: hypothetical protein KatS3mg054_0655 [Chloroflexus sp.]